jgi:hypothetical protein
MKSPHLCSTCLRNKNPGILRADSAGHSAGQKHRAYRGDDPRARSIRLAIRSGAVYQRLCAYLQVDEKHRFWLKNGMT